MCIYLFVNKRKSDTTLIFHCVDFGDLIKLYGIYEQGHDWASKFAGEKARRPARSQCYVFSESKNEGNLSRLGFVPKPFEEAISTCYICKWLDFLVWDKNVDPRVPALPSLSPLFIVGATNRSAPLLRRCIKTIDMRIRRCVENVVVTNTAVRQ